MAKKVIWTKRAFEDRKLILDYWIGRNKSNNYSLRLNHIFENTADLIGKYPRIGKKTEFQGIRIKIIKNYFLTYREKETSIEILTNWDYRQDPEYLNRIHNK